MNMMINHPMARLVQTVNLMFISISCKFQYDDESIIAIYDLADKKNIKITYCIFISDDEILLTIIKIGQKMIFCN